MSGTAGTGANGKGASKEKVLLIDDEENLLNGLRRHLRGKFNVLTANGGEAGLKVLEEEGAVAVVVCDMRMPGMDGVKTLEAFSKKSPDTVRIMLTGNADQDTAANAINTGQIFRFLYKPCEIEDLTRALNAALKQHRLVTAEKELLERTLAGSVKLLGDVVGLMDPHGQTHTAAMTGWGRKLARALELPVSWELDFAIMLAPLGQVAVPPELQVKRAEGEKMTAEEVQIFRGIPETGAELVANIPRLGAVADAVRYQDKHFEGGGLPQDGTEGEDIPLVARVLHVLKAVALVTGGRAPTASVFDQLEKKTGRFDPKVLLAARQSLAVKAADAKGTDEGVTEQLPVRLLRSGHTLLTDLQYEDGRLVLARGTVLSRAHIERLRAIAKVQKLVEPVSVTQTAE